ncbi:MAG: helix-turn-helix domain-containing protein [Lachnospiraceae bacterium]|nr:helix-turn-helix domain-containing protein [Lachnospiraceae bacterium]
MFMFEINKKSFGEFISMLRKEKSMTQKELASRLLVSDKAVSKWETGNSMSDITLLVPLAEVLEVTVTKLLECKRIEKKDFLDTDRTDEIVKKVITLSEEEQNLFRMNRKKRLVFFVPIVAVACVEAILLQVCAQFKNVPADNLYLFTVIGILCGCYFWIFAKEKIPAYYDQNKVTAYSDGVFRMNLVSTSINNSNWKYILQVGRIWSVVCMVVLPLLYFLLKVFLSDIAGRTGEYALIIICIAGLFVPMHVVAKKYE